VRVKNEYKTTQKAKVAPLISSHKGKDYLVIQSKIWVNSMISFNKRLV
jgi:hypothetical protein